MAFDSRDSGDLGALKRKLDKLEKSIQDLLEGANEDLTIAAALQKLLMPSRLPDIPGIQCFARYVGAAQVSSEAFDIISTKDNRQAWLVMTWTESFGLSSVLLQALVHFQGMALVEARPQATPTELFNDLSIALTGAKRSGRYRLLVARLDPANLNVTGVAIGMAPPFRRNRETSGFGPWTYVQPEALGQNPALLQPAVSASPVLADDAYHFSFTVNPGSRLYFMGMGWNPSQSLEEFVRPLDLPSQSAEKTDLMDDLNHLLFKAQNYSKQQGAGSDVSAVAFEIDSKKLHLA
jgi:hypothetical protein